MKFCKNCGQQLNDDAGFCPACGTPADNNAAPADNAAAAGNANAAAPVQPVVMDDATDVQSNRGIAWLSYVGLLFLVPLFARKRSEYCKFHVKQGATLCATIIAYEILQAILMAIIKAIFPGEERYSYIFGYYREDSVVTKIFSFLFAAGSVFLCVLAIIGIVNAAQGKKTKLPLIGQIPWVEMLMDKIYAALNK